MRATQVVREIISAVSKRRFAKQVAFLRVAHYEKLPT